MQLVPIIRVRVPGTDWTLTFEVPPRTTQFELLKRFAATLDAIPRDTTQWSLSHFLAAAQETYAIAEAALAYLRGWSGVTAALLRERFGLELLDSTGAPLPADAQVPYTPENAATLVLRIDELAAAVAQAFLGVLRERAGELSGNVSGSGTGTN